MVATKQLNIKDITYYFHDDLINLKDFDPKLLNLDKNYQKALISTTLDMLQKT